MTVVNKEELDDKPVETLIEDEAPVDNDPMILAMKEAEAEIAAEQGGTETKAETDGQKPAESAYGAKPGETEVKKGDDKAEMPMIPKARLDEALSKTKVLESQLSYMQGVMETQRQMMKQGMVPATDQANADQKAQESKPDPKAQIEQAEAKILDLVQKYEDGEISLVEFEKERLAQMRSIREIEEQRIAALTEEAKQTATNTASQLSLEQRIEAEAKAVQEKHPYVTEIDNLPPALREGVWAQINAEAAQNLAQRGINPLDPSFNVRMALIQEKAALTDKYGPQFTGKQLGTGQQVQQQPNQPSQAAQDRARKLDLAMQQPPEMPRSQGQGSVELTEDQILNMTEDQMADYLSTAPDLVLKAVGMKTR